VYHRASCRAARLEVAMTDVPLIWDALDEVDRRLAAGRPAVFLDFDGTLAPIVPRPEQAGIPDAARAAVARLGARMPVGVISGRDLQDVRRRVGVEGISYAGSHGFDILAADGATHVLGADHADDLAAAARRLGEALAPVAGALVERKRFSVATHTRNVDPADKAAVADAVHCVAACAPRLKLTTGKEVMELQPALPWDKGKALLRLLEMLGLDGPDVVPVFVGDDRTDEDAFRELAGGRGIGVLVAPEPRGTRASYRLSDPEDVARFLDRLADG
jgi:trehalose 6-phosphate phosphatase